MDRVREGKERGKERLGNEIRNSGDWPLMIFCNLYIFINSLKLTDYSGYKVEWVKSKSHH